MHAFLSPAEARHHLAVQREMADGHYPMPEDVTTGAEARLLDGALSPRVRAAYLVEGRGWSIRRRSPAASARPSPRPE